MKDFVVTAHTADNSEVFPEVLRLYVPVGSVVADVTWGNGVFWKRVDTSLYDLKATDIRPEHGGVDMRDLPYSDASLDAVVIDPPYMHTPGSIKTSIARGYYNNNDVKLTIRRLIEQYTDAFREAKRCLKAGGVVIVKCQDQVQAGKQCMVHVDLAVQLSLLGFLPEDIFVVVQKNRPTYDPKWTRQLHARKNHSYFLIYRKPNLRRIK